MHLRMHSVCIRTLTRQSGGATGIERSNSELDTTFWVTDYEASVPVRYSGILPDLFAEGEGVVAEGTLDESGMLIATQVLAKHDENYMPPEVAAALEGKTAPAEQPVLP